VKVKTISVVYGRKWNTDNYESATLEATVWADLDEGEDEKAAYAELFDTVKEQVRIQSAPVLVKRDERRRLLTEQVLNGLPKDLREAAQVFVQSAKNDVAVGNGK
jgi:hypothetical protein